MDLRTGRAYWKRRSSPPDRRFGWRASDQVALYQLRLGFHTGLETRNKMHIHSSDQVLFVTAGKGIIATEARQEVISVGDVVHIPAEEKHWHGATADSSFSHCFIYVDKILKGAKPADVPIEQPMKFDFGINLKAAKAINLTIPPNVLVRADRVIKESAGINR